PNLLTRIFGDDQALSHKFSTLTAFNHIKEKNSKNHWVILPFELNGNFGVIRIFLDLSLKTLQKILINYKSQTKKYYFVIYLKSKENRGKIRFYVENEQENSSDLNYQAIIKLMEENFNDFSIEYDQDLKENGMFTENSGITLISEGE
nr:hypothetical protein [Treponemataceae bacterium]